MTTKGQKVAGVISAGEWDQGLAGSDSTEKAAKVLSFLETLEKKEAASMKAIAAGTGLKWPYSTVVALAKKGGPVEEKKIGKAKYYRLRVK